MKISAIFFFALLLTSCGNDTNTSNTVTSDSAANKIETTKNENITANSVKSYGEKISEDGALDMFTLLTKLETMDSLECKVTGEITSTCAKKGCWMTINSPSGEEMRVTFKDYGFFVPVSEQEGKKAIMRGTAKIETTSVEMLRHYAEDAGQTAEEIAAITEDETNLAFEADGVLIQD